MGADVPAAGIEPLGLGCQQRPGGPAVSALRGIRWLG
jgi:hypothetical protein